MGPPAPGYPNQQLPYQTPTPYHGGGAFQQQAPPPAGQQGAPPQQYAYPRYPGQ
jgi:hypothetical protein